MNSTEDESNDPFQNLSEGAEWTLSTIVSSLTAALLAVVLGVALWCIGVCVISCVRRLFVRTLMKAKKSVDETLRNFLTILLVATLKILLFFMVLDTIGVSVLSFAALLAAIGVGIGSSVGKTLENGVSGVIIVVVRPFKVGDRITVNGVTGFVVDIGIIHTRMRTPSNNFFYVPNSILMSNIVTNDRTMPLLRANVGVSIAYGEDVEFVRRVVLATAVKVDGLVLNDPAKVPSVSVTEWGASSVNLVLRAWFPAEKVLGAEETLKERILAEFYRLGIEVPFPKRDVYLYKSEAKVRPEPSPEDADAIEDGVATARAAIGGEAPNPDKANELQRLTTAVNQNVHKVTKGVKNSVRATKDTAKTAHQTAKGAVRRNKSQKHSEETELKEEVEEASQDVADVEEGAAAEEPKGSKKKKSN
jgi:small conductance mechanosensitive channel